MRLAGLIGPGGRAAAAWAGLVSAMGAREALRRWRERRAFARQGDAPRDAVYAAIWRDAATELGAEVVEISPGLLEIRRGERWTRVRHQSTMLDARLTLDLAASKWLMHRLLPEEGLPVPEHVEVRRDELDAASEFLERCGRCVVKPAGGTGAGWGITGAVRTPGQLARAMLLASRYDPRVLLERQYPGAAYRLLFLDGELLDAVRRDRPSVEGDGEATVSQLIARENRRRLEAFGDARLGALRVDLDCLFTLEDEGLGLRSVPAAGALARVKTVCNENRLEDNVTVTEEVGDGLVADARRAVERTGLRLAGVDVLTTEPARSLGDAGGVLLEVNGAPGLSHHYHVREPERATRVAVPVLQALLEGPVGHPSAGRSGG